MIRQLLIDRVGRRQDEYEWRAFQPLPDMASIKSMLILHTDAKLGDAIINSMLIPAVADAYPHIKIAVGTTSSFEKFWRLHPELAEVVVLPDRGGGNPLAKKQEIHRAAAPHAGKFDVVISFDPYASFDNFMLLDALQAKVTIGFDKQIYRLFDYSLEDYRYSNFRRHISDRVVRLLQLFQIDRAIETLPMHAPFEDADSASVSKYLDRAQPGDRKVLFNTYGAADHRTLTPENTERLTRDLVGMGVPASIFVSLPKGRESEAAKLEALRSETVRVIGVPPLGSLFELDALVSQMNAVITPDSGVGHIAAAFKKPVVCLFHEGSYNPIVWKPLAPRYEAVISESGNINGVPWDRLMKAIRDVCQPIP